MNNFILEVENIDFITYIMKIFFLSIFSFYTFLKLINHKEIFKRKIFIIIPIMILESILCGIINNISNSLNSTTVAILIISAIATMIVKCNLGYSLIVTLISWSINYALFFIAVIIAFIPNIIIYYKNDIISLCIIIMIYCILLFIFLKNKRYKNGIISLREFQDNEYFDLLLLNISVILFFSFILLNSLNIELLRSLFIGIPIFLIMMIITIRKSLKIYYKQKLFIKEFNTIKNKLEDNKKVIKELETEILEYSKNKHSIVYRQKALEYKINELTKKNEISLELDISDRVRKLGKEISGKKVQIELKKTGIEEIDDMLEYMQSECINSDIEFELQINGNIHQMVNKCIAMEKLEILIADHIKNAIIAIQHSDNVYKNVLVRIGKIDGEFSLYIYDTGIEFEEETLEKIGKEPSTTHKDEGGSGMGFMNTFDTLKKCNASLVIKEIGKPSKDNFTKVLIIRLGM